MSIDHPERTLFLSRVNRWQNPALPPMRHQTDDLIHSRRVAWMLEDSAPLLDFPGFDYARAYTLAHVHDDAEIITGDITRTAKEQMTPEQRALLAEQERDAIDDLISLYGFAEAVHGYNYKALLLEAQEKATLESRVVSYLDKLDACMEAVHEATGGNEAFRRQALGYIPVLGELSRETLNGESHPLWQVPNEERLVSLATMSHTPASIREPTGLPSYDRWRELTIAHGEEERLVQSRSAAESAPIRRSVARP